MAQDKVRVIQLLIKYGSVSCHQLDPIKSGFFTSVICSNKHMQAVTLIQKLMEAASAPEMSGNFYQTTQCSNPEDSHLSV